MRFQHHPAEKLEQIHKCDIDAFDFQEAYREKVGATRATDMLYQKLPSVQEAVEMLADFDFAGLNPEILQEIEIEDDLVPKEFPRLLNEQTIRSKRGIWRIHKSDADPFPSSPHAHNLETGLKLHLGTGELYNKTRPVGKMRCKHLEALRGRVKKSIELPKYACR